MISASLGRTGGATERVVAVAAERVVVVVFDAAVVDVLAVTNVVVTGVVEVVVASAAGDVEGGAGGPVVTVEASEPVAEGFPLPGPSCSTGTADAPTVPPVRSTEAADELHAAAATATNSKSTVLCSLIPRLTLWLRQRLPPYRGRDRCDSAILNPEALSTTASPRLVQETAQ